VETDVVSSDVVVLSAVTAVETLPIALTLVETAVLREVMPVAVEVDNEVTPDAAVDAVVERPVLRAVDREVTPDVAAETEVVKTDVAVDRAVRLEAAVDADVVSEEAWVVRTFTLDAAEDTAVETDEMPVERPV
jgi:hypothetical protein